MKVVRRIFEKDMQHQWKECKKTFLNVPREDNSKDDISIITLEGFKKLTHDELKGFCHNRFKANLVVEDLDSSQIQLGGLLSMGEARIKISSKVKGCHKECPALKNNHVCTLRKHIFFAKVVQPGTVECNDEVIDIRF